MAAALGAGCTGVALNVMGTSADLLDEYRPLFEATRKSSGFLAAAARAFGRTPCTGIWIAHTPAHFSALNLEGDWETAPSWGLSFARYEELYQIGLPPAHSREGAAITLLTAEACDEFSHTELRGFLQGGVFLDGAALERLHDLGLGEQAGFRVRGRKDRDSIEVFAADPLNGRFAGWSRDCRPSFWPEPGYLLEPCAPGARPLSEMIDFAGECYGPASGVFENSLGGRVAVQGYFPWTMIQNLAKASQMHALARWLAKDTLPGYVSSYHRAALWCRNDPAGQPAFLLLNASISLKVLPAQTPRAQQILVALSDVSRLLRGDFTPDTIQRSVEILAKEPGERGGDPSC